MLSKAGFVNVYNIIDGMEGDKLDTAAIVKRRNTVSVHNKSSFCS